MFTKLVISQSLTITCMSSNCPQLFATCIPCVHSSSFPKTHLLASKGKNGEFILGRNGWRRNASANMKCTERGFVGTLSVLFPKSSTWPDSKSSGTPNWKVLSKPQTLFIPRRVAEGGYCYHPGRPSGCPSVCPSSWASTFIAVSAITHKLFAISI